MSTRTPSRTHHGPSPKIHQLTAKSRSLLLEGFCTTHNKNTPIPHSLSNLISDFNKSVVWVVPTNTFQYRKTSIVRLEPESTIVNTELFRFNGPVFAPLPSTDIRFQLRMEHTIRNNVQLQLCLVSDLSVLKIKNITMTVQLKCNETETEKRQFCLIDNDYNHIEVNALSFLEICTFTELVISCNAEILSIVFSEHEPYIRPIELDPYDRYIHFEWDLDSELLDKFKNCKSGHTFWAKNNFGADNNFSIYCMPNINGYCILFLQLLALQYPLNGIYVSYSTEIQSGNAIFSKYERKCQWLSSQSTLCLSDEPMSIGQLRTLESLKFVVRLKVLKQKT